MNTTPFDTLKLANSLREKAHFTPEQAEGVATAIAEAFQDQIATKNDLLLLEQRLTIKVGTMLAASIGIVTVIFKAF
ncbi:MAG: hypothetical protein M3Z96_03380 [Pseudomonadota bacterium]|nr:hypothetical protein [Pseudomonadota bacterium]